MSTRLGAATEALCKAHGFKLDEAERELLDATLESVRNALADSFEEDWATGAELDLAAAVEVALRSLG